MTDLGMSCTEKNFKIVWNMRQLGLKKILKKLLVIFHYKWMEVVFIHNVCWWSFDVIKVVLLTLNKNNKQIKKNNKLF